MAMRLSQKRSETVTPHSAPNLAYARPFVVQRQSEDREQALPEAGVSLLNNRYEVGATPNYQPGWIARAQAASQAKAAIGIQRKLAIGQPNDKYEQEADSVAEQVMSMPDAKPSVQREGMPGEEEEVQTKSLGSIQREMMPEEEEEIQAKPLSATITPLVQREAIPEEEEEIQAKGSSSGGVEAGGDFERRLGSSKSGGSPLPEDVRGFMEPRFGADFSGVRVHTGSEAVQMNQEVGAQAFAHGLDVYYGAGKGPGKDALTAHELTHVVQQAGHMQRRIQSPNAVYITEPIIQRDASTTNSNQITWPTLEARLQNSNRGREALQIKTQYSVPIQWRTTLAAASFSPDTKICYLNPTQKLDVLASYFVHEMNHAKMFHTNQSANAKQLDEKTFVEKMLNEEIAGTINQFESGLELNPSGAPSNYAPGEDLYRSAYKFKKDQTLAAGKSAQEAHLAGLLNGRRMVRFLIKPTDGTWPRLAPSRLESYEMMYKREWRSTNRNKTP
jgi:hypothetical protein